MAEKKNTKAAGDAKPAGTTIGSPMNTGFVEQLMLLMAANDLNTVDLRDGDRRVILKRGPAYVAAPAYAAGPAPSAPAPAPAATSGGAPTPATQSEESKLIPIKSQMVGTFYTAPKPGEKPFVTVGSRVVKDETEICVIEAMKNYFATKSDVSGTIVKILVENGQPVQVEQPMFLVKPD